MLNLKIYSFHPPSHTVSLDGDHPLLHPRDRVTGHRRGPDRSTVPRGGHHGGSEGRAEHREGGRQDHPEPTLKLGRRGRCQTPLLSDVSEILEN